MPWPPTRMRSVAPPGIANVPATCAPLPPTRVATVPPPPCAPHASIRNDVAQAASWCVTIAPVYANVAMPVHGGASGAASSPASNAAGASASGVPIRSQVWVAGEQVSAAGHAPAGPHGTPSRTSGA